MTTIHKILLLLTSALCVGIVAACSKDSYREPDGTTATGRPTMGITMGIDGTRSGDTNSDYEQGVGLENYLDISSDDYRIYFFSTDDNTFIARFRPISKPKLDETADGSNAYYYYSFFGEVPSDMPLDFKIVFIANWGSYPAEVTDGSAAAGSYSLVKGKTTIQDLCGNAEAQFSYLTSPADGGDWLATDGRLIPFYGVRQYDLNEYVDESNIVDGKIKGDLYIDLSKKDGADTSIPLLRAMAKVEVILDNPFVSFESVVINSVMSQGYCAPKKALAHTDYYRDGYNWAIDFVRGVHIPEAAQTQYRLPMTKVADFAGGTKEKWVAYVPEFQNIGIDRDATNFIEVTLAGSPDATKKIYFAPNGVNAADAIYDDASGILQTAGRFNIERNNIYRFTVSNWANLTVDVDVQPYAECFLDYKVGLMRDEQGDLMINKDSQFWSQLQSVFTAYPRMRPYVGGYVDGVFKTGSYDDYKPFSDSDKFEVIEMTPGPNNSIYDPLPEGYNLDDVKLPNGMEVLQFQDPLPGFHDGDYYAIVLPDNGNIRESEIWLKDADGCRVLSNFEQNVIDDENVNFVDMGCSARLVMDFSLITPDAYYKDNEGFQRLQHNNDHSSVVLNHSKEMVFKTVEQLSDGSYKTKKMYYVESLNQYDEKKKTGGDFWYRINIEWESGHANNPINPTDQVKVTYRYGDINGEQAVDEYNNPLPEGVADKEFTVPYSALTSREKKDLQDKYKN